MIVSMVVLMAFASCKKEETAPKLIFKMKLDPAQAPLGNLINSKPMSVGHAGQDPSFNSITAHYIELVQGALTQIGQGAILYHAEETTAGGDTAIDFSKSRFAKYGEVLYEIPLSSIAAGEYQYLRVSLAYQNFDVQMYIDTTIKGFAIQQSVPSAIASFVGYNTYLTNYKIKDQTLAVNGNRLQVYWGFETAANFFGVPFNYVTSGQAPARATTVLNPIAATSPIPAGSCLVTGWFAGRKLKITGKETEDIVVVVSLSTNKSLNR